MEVNESQYPPAGRFIRPNYYNPNYPPEDAYAPNSFTSGNFPAFPSAFSPNPQFFMPQFSSPQNPTTFYNLRGPYMKQLRPRISRPNFITENLETLQINPQFQLAAVPASPWVIRRPPINQHPPANPLNRATWPQPWGGWIHPYNYGASFPRAYIPTLTLSGIQTQGYQSFFEPSTTEIINGDHI